MKLSITYLLQLNELPLEHRVHFFPQELIYLLFLCILLLAVVKILHPDFLQHLIKKTFVSHLEKKGFGQETNRIKNAALLLNLNYFLSASVITFMLLTYFKVELVWLVVFIPIIFFFYLHLTLKLTGIITGESQKLISNHNLITFSHQLTGIILVPLGFIWYLNISYSTYLVQVIGMIFALIFLHRIIKGIRLAYENNIALYYIILYFCTLEIWPLAFLYVIT